MIALQAAFHQQARACGDLGSPFMARLMALCADHWPLDQAIARRFSDWPGDIGPSGASLPLRLAGALHALVLTGAAPALAACYPPHHAPDDALLAAIRAALRDHAATVTDWVASPPQTNELRRAATLLATMGWLGARFPGLPFHLSELGASAGLNLMADRFALDLGDVTLGDAASTLRLTPDWRGAMPPVAPITVTDRRGVDLNPLDPANPDHTLRLLAYLWPDQPDRIARTRAAITLAAAPVDRADAAPWLSMRLDAARPGAIHLIYHTVAWQYFPPATQIACRKALETAGARATSDAPLAWFGMEADGDGAGAGLRLRLWPGDHAIPMGRADFHGRWVDWRAPAPSYR